jgi:N,N'-diacetyllegionaminate synthase
VTDKPIEWLRPDGRAYCIAEAGVNHNGDVGLAMDLVDAAVAAGADAVKFQTYNVDRLLRRDTPKAAYQVATTGESDGQFDMLENLQLSEDEQRQLIETCAVRGIVFISTPFDEGSADLLEGFGVPLYKIPSGEITNVPLLRHVAAKNRPVILSTGTSKLGEVETAVEVLRGGGVDRLALMHCVSNYPTDPVDVNLRAMATMRSAFLLPVGLSDHTLGIETSIAAIALGARVIEKHLTLDKSMDGPDHQASLNPFEMTEMIRCIRNVEDAMGNGIKQPTASEYSNRGIIRKSIVFSDDTPSGTRLTRDHLTTMRPADGIPPDRIDDVLGKTLSTDVKGLVPLSWDVLEG